MQFKTALCSDTGICKKVNQDAAMLRQADTARGNVLFAAVCDGMGGLQKGEAASRAVIQGLADWFERSFPFLLCHRFTPQALGDSLTNEIKRLHERIRSYGTAHGIRLGTTMAALLLMEGAYYVWNVGDSRIYYLAEDILQLTKDHTFIQREIDMGRMTEEEAGCSSFSKVLLQCIGEGGLVRPDFFSGTWKGNGVFLLCSDGFRRVVTDREIWQALRPKPFLRGQDMDRLLHAFVKEIKRRQERDNITAVAVYTGREGYVRSGNRH